MIYVNKGILRNASTKFDAIDAAAAAAVPDFLRLSK